jgi:hypothetical protein
MRGYLVLEGQNEAKNADNGVPHVGQQHGYERVLARIVLQFENGSENGKDRRKAHEGAEDHQAHEDQVRNKLIFETSDFERHLVCLGPQLHSNTDLVA